MYSTDVCRLPFSSQQRGPASCMQALVPSALGRRRFTCGIIAKAALPLPVQHRTAIIMQPACTVQCGVRRICTVMSGPILPTTSTIPPSPNGLELSEPAVIVIPPHGTVVQTGLAVCNCTVLYCILHTYLRTYDLQRRAHRRSEGGLAVLFRSLHAS